MPFLPRRGRAGVRAEGCPRNTKKPLLRLIKLVLVYSVHKHTKENRERERGRQISLPRMPQICRERTDLGLAFKQQSGRCPNGKGLSQGLAKFAVSRGPTVLFICVAFWGCRALQGTCWTGRISIPRNRAGIQIQTSIRYNVPSPLASRVHGSLRRPKDQALL